MRTKHLLIAILAAFSLIGCERFKAELPLVPELADYKGTVSVIYQQTPFDNENIDVNFTPSADGKSASVTIYQIRFVPQMPVTIDVTIPEIELQSTKDKIILTCETVIPLAMGGEYPKYTVTNLHGEIVGDELSFSLNFGDYPTSFRGQINK